MQGPDLDKTWNLIIIGKSMLNYAQDMLALNGLPIDESKYMVAA